MKYLGAILLCIASFLWGFYAHRNHVFPHRLLRNGAVALGLLSRPRMEIAPRNGRTAHDRLTTLGYLQTSPVGEGDATSGVVLNLEDQAFDGLNFYKELTSDSAFLIDNNGREHYSWRFDPGPRRNWNHAELSPSDGALIGLVKDDSVFRLSADSALEWKTKTRAHHDLQVRPDGTIWALTRKDAAWPERYGTQAIIEDFVTVLSPDGQIQQEFSLLDPIKDSDYSYLLPSLVEGRAGEEAYDILHTNHMEVFDGSQSEQSTLFQEGNILVSYRTLNSIAILDKETHRVAWLWGPTNLGVQHHPRLLDNGNILIFDNGFDESRVVEIACPEGSLVWEYWGENDFHSYWGGSVQRLPNSNTLVTNSAKGEVFEVTMEGEIVWRFVNPRLEQATSPEDASGGAARWNIWRMTRYPRSKLPFL